MGKKFCTILYFYFIINSVLAGYFLSDNYKWLETRTEKIICILRFVFILLFGSIYTFVFYSVILFLITLLRIDSIFLISRFYNFYFTDYYRKYNDDKLTRMNKICKKENISKSLTDQLTRYLVNKINKQHDFVYNENNNINQNNDEPF